MASNKQTAKSAQRNREPRRELSPGTKKALIIGVAGVVVLVGGIWAFEVLTAPAKPDIQTAKVPEITQFLGHPRGLARMPVAQREEFLVAVVQKYSEPNRVEEMSRALREMAPGERETLMDATFEIGKDKFVKAAEEYVQLPKKDRPAFLDKVIHDVENLRQRLGGAPAGGGGVGPAGVARPGPVNNLVSPFKEHIPTKSDAMAKMIVDRTTPSERAKAKPLMDDLAQRSDQLRRDPRARADFTARGG